MKIKFLDNNEIVTVTRANQLANTKTFARFNYAEVIKQLKSVGLRRWTNVDFSSQLIFIFDDGYFGFPFEPQLYEESTKREFQFLSIEAEPVTPDNEPQPIENIEQFEPSGISGELKPVSQWVSVEDQPLCKDDVLTKAAMNEFLAAVPTNKGWWIRYCTCDDFGCLNVICDDHIESAGWEITDVTHWMPITEPYTLAS